jgi:preprotein translocase subunit SecY
MYIPLRFNQAGIMPIVLTNTIFKKFNYKKVFKFLYYFKIPIFYLTSNYLYWSSYFILVLILSLLYSTFQIDPFEISNELQNMSVSIPGIQPGIETIFYLKQVIKRITFISALILAYLLILPEIVL